MTDLVPYTFGESMLPASAGGAFPPGQLQGVHFTVTAQISWILEKLEQWFRDRNEVILVAHGSTRQGLGFVILEWEECEVDPLFLAILEHEDIVADYAVYTRTAEV